MQYLSPSQCRAARALLDWSQPELAKKSNVHVQTISAFENETGTPTKSTLEKVMLAFEKSGIQFLDHHGVQMKHDNVRIYEGNDLHKKLLDEIYHDMKKNGGEILIKGVSEKKWESLEDQEFLKNHIKRLIKANISERLIISETDNFLVAPKNWYRTIPKKYFSPQTQWIFQGKVAMLAWGTLPKLIIIESPTLYETETRTFNCIWENIAKPIE